MDTRDIKIANLKSQLKKKDIRAEFLEENEKLVQQKLEIFSNAYHGLYKEHEQLERRFEANFKFHEYIKDVLDATADLMKEV